MIATWKHFSTRIFHRDLSFQVSSNFLNDEEQTKTQMATLGQELKNLRSELQEHRVNAVEDRPKPKRKTTSNTMLQLLPHKRKYLIWCRKKIRHEELKRIENERIADKKVKFFQEYNKKRGAGLGSEQWVRSQDFQRRNQNYTSDGPTRNSTTAYQNCAPRPNFAHGNNNPNNGRSYEQRPYQSFNGNDGNRSRNGSFNGNWQDNGKYSVDSQERLLIK